MNKGFYFTIIIILITGFISRIPAQVDTLPIPIPDTYFTTENTTFNNYCPGT
jgi:hypothetical protein